jgi:thiol-disulfide isomerase/thioredoxin
MNSSSFESPNRPDAAKRRLLFAGVGAAAAAVGAGVALFEWRAGEVADDAVSRLWPLVFDTPDGPPLALSQFQGKPLLVNFWATWCPPCVEELPLIDRFYRESAAKKWQVIGLAIDQPSAVKAFLKRTPVSFPVGFAGLGGTELCKSLGNAGGGLPFTIVIGPTGKVLERRMGRVRADDLAHWALRV